MGQMGNLTLLYYTANVIKDLCAEKVRARLLAVAGDAPIISVSQKPLDFGHNICVGQIGQSHYNCYKQIYIGAQAVRTQYVACCEDDTLYTEEHFSHRPSADDVFAYNVNMWYIDDHHFWQKQEANDTGMCMCIAPTELLVNTLAPRFEMYPNPPVSNDRHTQRYWQEPGRFDRKFGIPNAKIEYFRTRTPMLVFNHRGSLGGKRGSWAHPRTFIGFFPEWGNARTLRSEFWGTPP